MDIFEGGFGKCSEDYSQSYDKCDGMLEFVWLLFMK